MEETGHYIDDEGQDYRTEEVRQKSVREGDPPNSLGPEVRVGDLGRHADSQAEIREVRVGRWIVFVEIDPSHWSRVVGPCVSESEDGLDQPPGRRHADEPESDQVRLRAPRCASGPDKAVAARSQYSDTSRQDNELGQAGPRILPVGVLLALLGVEIPYSPPDPTDEEERPDVPADQHRCLPERPEGHHDSRNDSGQSCDGDTNAGARISPTSKWIERGIHQETVG